MPGESRPGASRRRLPRTLRLGALRELNRRPERVAHHLLKDEEARKRFNRETQAAAALHHPNVCPVYEIGEADGQNVLGDGLH